MKRYSRPYEGIQHWPVVFAARSSAASLAQTQATWGDSRPSLMFVLCVRGLNSLICISLWAMADAVSRLRNRRQQCIAKSLRRRCVVGLYYTNHKEICRIIAKLLLFLATEVSVSFFFKKKAWTICMCVCVCVGMCAASSPYLLPPGHSADIHSKGPLVVIHGDTQLSKNVTIRGRWETKRGRFTQRKWQVVWVWSPTNHPVPSVGFPYLLWCTSSFPQHHPHNGVLRGKFGVWHSSNWKQRLFLNTAMW